MAYTYDQIIQAYTALHVGKAPDKATADSLQMTANLNASGQVSDAQVLNILMNGADSTTAVAVMSYQFFTGKSPTAAGLTYLVNSPINTSDLNDGYYAKFNIENRYINFAANLGLYGEGATAFANKYGAMDFNSYVASIYQTIIGRSYAEAASINVDAAIAYLISTKDAVLQTVREAGLVTANSSAAQIDLAVKAAMSGLVMAAAIKADVGLYAAATDNFMVALAQGTAVYGTDITLSYRPTFETAAHGNGKPVDRAPTFLPDPVSTTPVTPPPAPIVTSFTLGAGANNITGSALDDTFTATAATVHSGDILNGGGGNDVLNINSTGTLNIPAMTVSNIETVNFTSAGLFRWISNANWTGVQTVNATGVGSFYVELTGAGIRSVANVNATVNAQGTNMTTIYGGHNVTATINGGGIGDSEITNVTGNINITRTNVGDSIHGYVYAQGNASSDGTTVVVTQISDLTGVANGSTQTNGRCQR